MCMIDSTTTFLDLSVVVDDARIACVTTSSSSARPPQTSAIPAAWVIRPAERSVPFAYATAAGRRSRQLTGCA